MPRIAPIEPPYAEPYATAFQQVFGNEEPLVLFTTVATSKRAWEKFVQGSLLAKSLLPVRERELVITRTCARTKCEWEWGVHIQRFRDKAGFTDLEVAQTLQYPVDPNRWSDREATLIQTVDALHDRATLGDDEYAALGSHYSDDQILEIIQLTGNYHSVSFLANGLALPLEGGAPRFGDYKQML